MRDRMRHQGEDPGNRIADADGNVIPLALDVGIGDDLREVLVVELTE